MDVGSGGRRAIQRHNQDFLREGLKMEKFCGAILITYFGDVI